MAHNSKCTFDLEVTLTFDLSLIQSHVMNDNILKHICTKFGTVMVGSLCGTMYDVQTDGQTDGLAGGGSDGRVTNLSHLPVEFPEKTCNTKKF